MKKTKDNRGGPGRNQGRKLKYGEETVKVNYRVPVSMKPKLDKYVAKKLEKYAKKAASNTEGGAGKKTKNNGSAVQ